MRQMHDERRIVRRLQARDGVRLPADHGIETLDARVVVGIRVARRHGGLTLESSDDVRRNDLSIFEGRAIHDPFPEPEGPCQPVVGDLRHPRRKVWPERRPTLLSRKPWVGQQRPKHATSEDFPGIRPIVCLRVEGRPLTERGYARVQGDHHAQGSALSNPTRRRGAILDAVVAAAGAGSGHQHCRQEDE
jgi:hypothetical protein